MTFTLSLHYLYLIGLDTDQDFTDDDLVVLGDGGKLRLRRGKKVDLSRLSEEMMRKLGIDPSLTSKEKARLLRVSHLELLFLLKFLINVNLFSY